MTLAFKLMNKDAENCFNLVDKLLKNIVDNNDDKFRSVKQDNAKVL